MEWAVRSEVEMVLTEDEDDGLAFGVVVVVVADFLVAHLE